jgi:MFS family permease
VAALAKNGAILLTLYMFGNMCFKFFFGYTNDKLGVFRSTLLELATLMTGCILLLSHIGNPMMIGAILFGTCAMLSNVQYPLIVRTLWDKEHFARAYATISMIADASYYLSITLFGVVYDVTGRYEPVLMICMGAICVEAMIACGLFCRKNTLYKRA